MSERPNLKDFSVDRLRARFGASGLAPYRADQVAAWMYARGVEDPEAMTDLPLELRRRLAGEFQTRALDLETLRRASDGTTKGLLRATDGVAIESVLIPEGERTTLCVSTQVGCSLDCSFCATGAMGFTRNLTAAEIIDQVCRMKQTLPEDRELSNVVFMGMGEPLLNLPAVLEAIELLLHPKAFALAPRRVTVSTAGLVPRIPDLVHAAPVNLAVSLHSPRNDVRDVLVPLNRRFPLEVLLETLRGLPFHRRRPVFFEYTLMAGVNDDPADAREVVRIVRGIPCKVNLIPMNPHADAPYLPPEEGAVAAFGRELLAGGLTVTLRRPRGLDIDAACGQLALRNE